MQWLLLLKKFKPSHMNNWFLMCFFFKNGYIFLKCTVCTDFFSKIVRIVRIFSKKKCTDCTDFFWKCTDFCTDFFKKVLATLIICCNLRIFLHIFCLITKFRNKYLDFCKLAIFCRLLRYRASHIILDYLQVLTPK